MEEGRSTHPLAPDKRELIVIARRRCFRPAPSVPNRVQYLTTPPLAVLNNSVTLQAPNPTTPSIYLLYLVFDLPANFFIATVGSGQWVSFDNHVSSSWLLHYFPYLLRRV